MRELYYGVTQLNGASYLNRSLIQMDEGFVIGASTEYISSGQYFSDSINYENNFSERISITGKANRNNSDTINTHFTRNVKKRNAFYTDFRTGTDYSENFVVDQGVNWTPTDSGSYTGGSHLLITHLDSNGNYSNLKYNKSSFGDFAAELIGRITGATTNNIDLGIMTGNFDGQSWTGYTFKMYAGRSNYAAGEYYDGTNVSLLFGISLGFTMGQNYYMRLYKFNQQFRFWVSNSESLYSYVGGVSVLLGDFDNDVGIRTNATLSSGVTVLIDEVSFQELRNQYTTEDIIKYGYNLGNINELSFQDDFNLNSVWVGTSDWGVSNNILTLIPKTQTSVGTCFHTYYLDTLIGDFVADYEINFGSSSVTGYLGALVGTSINDFFVMQHKFGSSNITTGNAVNLYSRNLGAKQKHQKSQYSSFMPQKWLRQRIVKQSDDYSVYTEGVLSMYYHGESLVSGVTGYIFGFALHRNGVSGIPLQIRNIRISKIDNPITDDVILDVGSNPMSLVDRYIPEGYDWTQTYNTINLFQIGASRGTHSIMSNYKVVSDNRNNSSGFDLSIFTGKNNRLGFAYTYNTQKQKIVNSSTITNSKDESITNNYDESSLARYKFADSNKGMQIYNIEIVNRPEIEQYDRVLMIDPKTGITTQYIVYEISKRYSINGFISNLQLGYDTDQL